MLHVVIDFRRAQQRLGRNAAPVQADAAEIGFFDDRGLEAELRGADRGDVAAGAGADDDNVEGGVSDYRSIRERTSSKPVQSTVTAPALPRMIRTCVVDARSRWRMMTAAIAAAAART